MDNFSAISLVVGIIVGTLSSIFAMYIWLFRKRKIKERIDNLKWEKEHLTKIRKSSIEFNRYAFLSILWVLFLIALAESIPRVFGYIGGGFLTTLSQQFSMILWLAAAAVAFTDIRRFLNIRKYQETMTKIDSKIEKLESKLNE